VWQNSGRCESLETSLHLGQPDQYLVNPVKISTLWVCTRFGWKEEFGVGEKQFVWGSKQARQYYMCKVEKSDRVKLATTRVQLAMSRIKPGSASG